MSAVLVTGWRHAEDGEESEGREVRAGYGWVAHVIRWFRCGGCARLFDWYPWPVVAALGLVGSAVLTGVQTGRSCGRTVRCGARGLCAQEKDACAFHGQKCVWEGR